MRLPPGCQGVRTIKVLGAKTDFKNKWQGDQGVAWVSLFTLVLVGGLLAAGATGDLVAAGRYDLLFGPTELAQSVFSLGDIVDEKMALQSALAREYGATNTAQAIQLLSERYNAAHPMTIPTPDFNNMPTNNNNPLNGIGAGGRAMKDYYSQLFKAMPGDADRSLR